MLSYRISTILLRDYRIVKGIAPLKFYVRAGGMPYYMYERYREATATLHDAECAFCNEGQGVTGNRGTRTGRWLGPYLTWKAAHADALHLSPRGTTDCSFCVGRSGG